MSVVIFAGPSLPPSERDGFSGFSFRPPVRQGELYAAARRGARVIGIIDGYFDGVPAVWHKEVLWALQQGIAVFGAASMGALRAAELHDFGMQGIGRIFRDFRDGHLCDDDEVALLHGPDEAGYPALSEPMVNIRATVESAVAAQILTDQDALRLIGAAKAQFYQDRSWASVVAADHDIPAPALRVFSDWLTLNRVDQKRLDAHELLDVVAALPPGVGPARFNFEWTEAWANAPWLADADVGEDGAVLDELRLEGEAYLALRRAALLQQLAGRAMQAPAASDIAAATRSFRLRHGLLRQSDVEGWAIRNGLPPVGLDRLIASETGLAGLARDRDGQLGGAILDQLRLQGRYEDLRDRATGRAGKGGQRAGSVPALPLLLAWYFEVRLGLPIPEDLPAYLRDLGFADPGHFYGLVMSEFLGAQNCRE